METTTPSQIESALVALESVLPKKGRVLIIPHNYPDPDAMAAAAAIELLLAKRFHLRGQIAFTGAISRAENRELLKHFRYKWRYLYQVHEPAKGKLPCIFADTAPWSGNVTVPRYVRPVAVFDHHPLGRHAQPAKESGLFTDIRSGTGASASILYEYLQACEIAIPKWLATIMAYAIATETMDLSTHTTDLDLKAYHDLLARGNMSVLGEIRHAPLPRSYYGQLQEAMQNAYVYGRVAWSHLDDVQHPEIVSEIADLLLRAERITYSFCTAICEKDMLVSLRSSHSRARCGYLIKRVIGSDGSAGGHHRMAAGVIDVKELSSKEREARRLTLVKALLAAIEHRTLEPGETLDQMAKPLVETRAAVREAANGQMTDSTASS
jgi:nanoRNase/pAp phosphatase (c-di-AMP/oligoRNAs hydrolase)